MCQVLKKKGSDTYGSNVDSGIHWMMCILMGCLFLSPRGGFFHRDFSIGQGLETRVTIEPLAKLMYQVVQSDLFIP